MFQTRLKELREAAGFKSQQAFADVFGVAQSTVGGWEAGKREPNYETTIRLAKFFGVSVDSLINDEKGDLFMSEKNELCFRYDGWLDSELEDYNNLKYADQRRLFILNTGYDKDHEPDARRLLPEYFSKKEPTPVSEGGPNETAQRFMPLVDRLTPDQQQLLLAQLQAWTAQNEQRPPAAPAPDAGKAPESDP